MKRREICGVTFADKKGQIAEPNEESIENTSSPQAMKGLLKKSFRQLVRCAFTGKRIREEGK